MYTIYSSSTVAWLVYDTNNQALQLKFETFACAQNEDFNKYSDGLKLVVINKNIK